MWNLSPQEQFQIVFGLVSGLVSLLMFGNIFFVKKLVHKIDQVEILSANVSILTEKVEDLTSKIDLLYELKIELATLKTRFLATLKHTRYGSNGELIDEETGEIHQS